MNARPAVHIWMFQLKLNRTMCCPTTQQPFCFSGKLDADAGKWKVITNGSRESLPVQGGYDFKYSERHDPLSQPSPAALTQTLPPAILELPSL